MGEAESVIRVENLGKKYQISHQASGPYKTLRESMLEAGRTLKRRLVGSASSPQMEEFWALRDVSFEVKRGEVVGIIGRNGAGKSTLLKLLSRITEPTTGRIELEGRVASLLEVGTGFHPELTGRENVYMNGAILGMTRAEIKRKFEEIVAFAEVEKFLDTPVKRYSSGMYVRLAFAVAAHLEPEILIVDEVLAVGDAQFQQKCLSRMQTVARAGRTVLFVSHQLGTVQKLCTSGIVLDRGRVLLDGSVDEALTAYLDNASRHDGTRVGDRKDRGGSGLARLTDVRVVDSMDRGEVRVGRSTRFEFEISRPLSGLVCVFTVYTMHGQAVLNLESRPELTGEHGPNGSLSLVCQVPRLMLLPGTYRLNAALRERGAMVDHLESATVFTVHESVIDNQVVRANPFGLVYAEHGWSTEFSNQHHLTDSVKRSN